MFERRYPEVPGVIRSAGGDYILTEAMICAHAQSDVNNWALAYLSFEEELLSRERQLDVEKRALPSRSHSHSRQHPQRHPETPHSSTSRRTKFPR